MHRQPYFLEPSLPLRVKKYMIENKQIDVEVMTDYLIQTYQDFRNKKKKVFMKSVRTAYQWELSQRFSKNLAGETDSMDVNDFYELDREESPDIVEVSIEKETKMEKKQDYSFSIDKLYKLSSPATNGPTSSQTLKHEKITPQSFKNLKRRREGIKVEEELLTPNPVKRKKSFVNKLTPTYTLSDFVGENSISPRVGLIYKYLRGDREEELPRTLFISGPKGSGKSMMIECLAGDLSVPIYRISAASLSSGVGVDTEGVLSEIFAEAVANAPCILHIENVDDLSSKEFGSAKKTENKIIKQLIELITGLSTTYSNNGVVLVAESRSRMIDAELFSFFTFEISLPVLEKEAKVSLLKEFIAKKGPVAPDVDFDAIADRTTSFVARDLKNLAEKAGYQASFRVMQEKTQMKFPASRRHIYFEQTNLPKNEIKMKDIMTVLPTITPTLKQEGFPRPSNVKWEDVQGLEDVKKMIMLNIIGPIKDKELHSRLGMDKPNGTLLYGPPGCGKTLLAEAIANAVGVNLLSVKGPELLHMYQGESERQVREVFRRAESVAPCVIFFDEFDCLCPKRTGQSESGSRSSIVNTLLAEMDGFGEKHEVYVIAATNRPDIIDPAVLRPGRIGTILYVGLPDLKGRMAIFQSCAEKKKVVMGSDVNFEEVASWCDNFSGADCAELFKAACKETLSEAYPAHREGRLKDEDLIVFNRHFETALTIARPSVSTEARKEYLNMKARLESSLERNKK